MKVKSIWDVLPLTLVLVVLVSGCPGSPNSKCTKNENCDTGYLCNSKGMCAKPDIYTLSFVTETIKTAIVGENYSENNQLIEIEGGLSPYTWSLTVSQDSTTLLGWLDIDENSGLLRNKQGMVPTKAQMTNNAHVTVTVTDDSNGGSGQTVSKEYTMVIAECDGSVADCYESDSDVCYVGTAPCLAGILGVCTRSSSASNNFYRCGPACGPCNADTESCCDGSCIDTTSNPEHCGSCANNCNVANASGSTCSNSTCLYKCDSNYGNCDNDWTNGCEENLLSSAAHCGACGATCKGHTAYNPTCNGGICSCEDLSDCDNTAIPWADVCIVGGLCECSTNSYIPCPIGQYCCSQKGCCLTSCSDAVCRHACEQAPGKVWCTSGCCDSCNPDTNCG